MEQVRGGLSRLFAVQHDVLIDLFKVSYVFYPSRNSPFLIAVNAVMNQGEKEDQSLTLSYSPSFATHAWDKLLG